MAVAIEPQRLVRRRDARAQGQIAPRALLDLLQNRAPLLLDPRDRVVAADRVEPPQRLAVGDETFPARRLVVGLAGLELAEFLFERRSVRGLEGRARRVERVRRH